MPNVINWAAAWVSRGVVNSTQAASLADGSRSGTGSTIANQTNLDMVGKIEMQVSIPTAPASDGHVVIYMLTAPDGTTYEDGSSNVAPTDHNIVGIIPVRATTTAQRLTTPPFALQPAPTVFLQRNESGQAFGAGGSTLTLFTSNEEIQ